MTGSPSQAFTVFSGCRRIAAGSLAAVALAVKQAMASPDAAPVLIFDDNTGRSIDIDVRGSDEEVLARLNHPAPPAAEAAEALAGSAGQRGRGRPKLGVVAREVTLLPRHWEWLATQPGGASVALRKLVEAARRTGGDQDRRRRAQERAYHFMSAMAGDLPGFEEAARALFADDRGRLEELTAPWPRDIRNHALALAFRAER